MPPSRMGRVKWRAGAMGCHLARKDKSVASGNLPGRRFPRRANWEGNESALVLKIRRRQAVLLNASRAHCIPDHRISRRRESTIPCVSSAKERNQHLETPFHCQSFFAPESADWTTLGSGPSTAIRCHSCSACKWLRNIPRPYQVSGWSSVTHEPLACGNL